MYDCGHHGKKDHPSSAFNSDNPGRFWTVLAQEWPLRAPNEFTDLLCQRCPEALVILANFTVLFHLARGFWCIGDAGKVLFKCVAGHLGEYWTDWLEWPMRMLADET